MDKKCWIELRETFIKCPPQSTRRCCEASEERSRKAKREREKVLACNSYSASYSKYNLLMCKSKLLRRKITNKFISINLFWHYKCLIACWLCLFALKSIGKMIETWIYGNLKYVRHMKTLSMTCLSYNHAKLSRIAAHLKRDCSGIEWNSNFNYFICELRAEVEFDRKL